MTIEEKEIIADHICSGKIDVEHSGSDRDLDHAVADFLTVVSNFEN